MAVVYLDLQRGLRGDRGRRVGAPRSVRARRSGSAALLVELIGRAARRSGLLALMLLHDSRRDARTDAARRPRAARGSRSRALGPRADRRGARARADRAARRRAGPYRVCRPRSRRCTPRRSAPPTPTGRRSRRCSASCTAASRRRSSRSTAPSRSRCGTGPADGLAAASTRSPTSSADYHLWHAARADLLRRLGRTARGRGRLSRGARARRLGARAPVPRSAGSPIRLARQLPVLVDVTDRRRASRRSDRTASRGCSAPRRAADRARARADTARSPRLSLPASCASTPRL